MTPTTVNHTRRRTTWLTATTLAAGAVVLATGCAAKVPQGLSAVTPFDVQRYAGTWHEIARIDHRFQKDLVNASAEYTLNADGTVKVVNRGYNAKKQEWKGVEGKAKFTGAPDVAALKVSFFGPFYSGYNVVDLDPQYQTALVVGDDTGYFWLLARDKNLPRDRAQALLHKAQGMGVDLSKVIWTQQPAMPHKP